MLQLSQIVNKVLDVTKQNEYSRAHVTALVESAIEEMKTSGVKDSVAFSTKSLGFICSYVTDLDTPNSGNIKLSDYTQKKLIQLATIKTEEDVGVVKYGALLVNFKCDDDIPVTLNILQEEELKYTYKINKAVVEILPIGDYTIEIIVPDEYNEVDTAAVSVLENESVEVYKKVVKKDAETVDVNFSCQNNYDQYLAGHVYKFENRTTNEVVGTFTSTNDNQVIKIPAGYYAITPVAIPNGYSSKTYYYTVNADKDNNIKISTSVGSTKSLGNYIYLNGKSLNAGYVVTQGVDIHTYGTWKLVKNLDGEIISTKVINKDNIITSTLSLPGRYDTADYTLSFEPEGDLILPASVLKQSNKTDTKIIELMTKDGYGAIRFQVKIGSSMQSTSNSKDFVTYSVVFTNTETGEQFTREYNAKYAPTGSTSLNSVQANLDILPVGTYTYKANNVQGDTNTYTYNYGTKTLTITNGSMEDYALTYTKS